VGGGRPGVGRERRAPLTPTPSPTAGRGEKSLLAGRQAAAINAYVQPPAEGCRST